MEETHWPPRSPHEVLLATPGGRERLRRIAEQTSPSPSKSAAKARMARSASALAMRSGNSGADLGTEGIFDMDEDEDEETLQLKLEMMQARLKLKKLKAAKARQDLANESDRDGLKARSQSALAHREGPGKAELMSRQGRADVLEVRRDVQVPASPVKKLQQGSNLPPSPQRVLLGIDKGKKAADMTLKRVAQNKAPQDGRASQLGGYLRRSKTPLPGQDGQHETSRPLTFNERLAAARTEEVERRDRQQKIQSIRTTAFGVSREEMEGYKGNAVDIPQIPDRPPEFTRDQILGAAPRITAGYIPRSNTAPVVRSTSRVEQYPDQESYPTTAAATGGRKTKVPPAQVLESEASALEPYSGFHLTQRILPHTVLTRSISGKKTYLIKDLLKHVKAPDWSLPDVESDVVLFAIIAGKSDPRSHKPGPGKSGQQQDRGKYMVMTLVDLTYEVELYLFNSGFDRFWKLTPGTVVAVLNPVIMPPPQGREATGRFGLVINSDADSILELGKARDLGFCKSVKKDGHFCNSWVNSKRTEYCEFHTNEAVKRTRSDRMEFNTSGFGGGRRKVNSRDIYLPDEHKKKASESKHGSYDRTTMSHFYVSGDRVRGGGITEEEREGGTADRAQRAESIKRRTVAREKERDIAKKLSEIGSGAGRDYLARSITASAKLGSSIASSVKTSSTLNSSQEDRESLYLGLTRTRDSQTEIDLGRTKRKRAESTQSNSAAPGATLPHVAALGWGSTLKDKLGRMKGGETLDGRTGASADPTQPPISSALSRGERSPVRKKTRFVTEKGIREAGRESLGEPLAIAAPGGRTRRQILLDDDDDDDDLVIV